MGKSLQRGGELLDLPCRSDVIMVLFFCQGTVKENNAAQVSQADICYHGMGRIDTVSLKSKEKELSDFLFYVHGDLANVYKE